MSTLSLEIQMSVKKRAILSAIVPKNVLSVITVTELTVLTLNASREAKVSQANV